MPPFARMVSLLNLRRPQQTLKLSVVAFSFLGSLAICGLLAGCGKNDVQQPTVTEVGVVTIHQQQVALTSELPGRTAPYQISEIRPQVGGIIQKRLFVEGAEVKSGQVLYQIDPASYQATYDRAKATLSAAKAKADRYSRLIQSKAISQQDYDDAMASYREAAADYRTAQINLNYTRITAPISGRIGISSVTAGALVTADQSTALTTIQTLDPMYVNIPQSSTQMLKLKQAIMAGTIDNTTPATTEVSLQLENGTSYEAKGKLQFADITVDPDTGSVTLRAIFPNPKGVLLPGMFVRAIINEGTAKNAILAPQQGIFRDTRGLPQAWVVDKNNKAQLRQLKIDRAVGNNWLITEGLKDGDRLIVQGLQNMHNGVSVRPVSVHLAP